MCVYQGLYMIKNLDSPLTVFRHELNHFIFTFYNLIWVLCTVSYFYQIYKYEGRSTYNSNK